MRNKLLALAITAALARSVEAKDISFGIPIDKRLHALGSYALTFTGAQVLHRLGVPYPELWAGLAVGTFGLYKEVAIDEKGDRDDFKADLIGVGLGVGMSYSVRF